MEQSAHIEDIQRRIFASMLEHLDDSVGRVLTQLRESGVEVNTLIVFLSDNGGPTIWLTTSARPVTSQRGFMNLRRDPAATWRRHPAGFSEIGRAHV